MLINFKNYKVELNFITKGTCGCRKHTVHYKGLMFVFIRNVDSPSIYNLVYIYMNGLNCTRAIVSKYIAIIT